ncbi:MAG: sigma-70 family RNA polymerase sigma factor [Myxococcota bacterium]|nr:sigma-70 family RNA polymerase sigma factor [Myxococcota bacterium]
MSNPDPTAQQLLEQRIREHAEAARWKEAATVAIEGYGPELLGFVMAVLRNESAASEVFSQLCEDVWSGLEGFRWQSSFRTWAYTIARHATGRYLRSPHLRRNQPLEDDEISKIADRVRSSTLNYLRSGVKEKVQRIRESLEPDDQTLLILRVDRNLAWNEVAQVMLGEDEEHTPQAISRKSAALRKRFERLKEDLKRLAREHRLLEED